MTYTAPKRDFQGSSTAPRQKLEALDLSEGARYPEVENAQKPSVLEGHFSILARDVSRKPISLDDTVHENEPPSNSCERLAEGDHRAAEQVKEVIKARRSRSNYFRGDLFADPAWDILLDLSRAELEGQRVTVTSLCSAASVPPTTALRWIKTLLNEEVLASRMDPLDGRRKFIELTESASISMQQYLSRFATPVAGLI